MTNPATMRAPTLNSGRNAFTATGDSTGFWRATSGFACLPQRPQRTLLQNPRIEAHSWLHGPCQDGRDVLSHTCTNHDECKVWPPSVHAVQKILAARQTLWSGFERQTTRLAQRFVRPKAPGQDLHWLGHRSVRLPLRMSRSRRVRRANGGVFGKRDRCREKRGKWPKPCRPSRCRIAKNLPLLGWSKTPVPPRCLAWWCTR